MSFSVIASGGAQSTNSGSSVTTSALNCTGADLLIVAASYAHDGVVSDSNGNTYTQVLSEGGAGPSSSRSSVTLWASTSPTVGAGMTFSFTSNSFPSRPTFPGIGVLAVSGSSGAGADQTNGADTFPPAVNSTVPGSITPTQADELWVSVLCQQSSGNAPSANLGTVVFNSAPTSQAEGFGMVYGVQTSATAVNVTWSWTGSTAVAQSGVASFFASSVPPVSASCEGIVQTAGAISAVALGAACVGTAHCAGSAIGTLSGSAVGKVTCSGTAAGVIKVSAVGVVHCAGSCVSAAGSTAAGVVHCSGSATGTLEASCVGVVHCSGSIPHANVSASCQGRVSCSGSCAGTLEASCVGIVHCSGSCSATTGVSCVGVVHCSGFASGTLEASCVGLVHCSGSCHATLEASCIGTVHCSGSCHGTLSVSCVGVVHCSGSIGQGISASCVGVVHCSGSCTALTPRIGLVGQVVCSGSIAAHLSVTAVGQVQCGGSISVTASISTNCQGVVHCHGYALGTFHVKCAGIVHCYGWCVIGLAGSPMGCLEANPPWMPPAPVKPANYVY